MHRPGRRAGVLVSWVLTLAVGATAQSFPSFPQISTRSQEPLAQKSAAPKPEFLKELPAAIVRDQKPIWLFPVRAARGQHWKPVLAVTLGTTGLVFLDPHDTPYFRRTQAFRGFNRTFTGTNTGLVEGTFPLGMYLIGRARRSSSTQHTALLAAEALADAQMVSEVMKNLDRRLRPSEIPPHGDFGHTWFKEGGGILLDRGSFPSGHVIGAFALATVIAERYRRHRWVPWAAYGAAALVGFSRMTLQAHFPSDVFAGAALGYSISHFVVLRHE